MAFEKSLLEVLVLAREGRDGNEAAKAAAQRILAPWRPEKLSHD